MGVAAFAVLGTPWECSRSCFALCCPVQFAENILAVCLKNQEEQRTFLGCWALPSQDAGLLCRKSHVVYSMCRPSVSPLPSSSSDPTFSSALLHSSMCTDTCMAVLGFL